MATRSEDAAGMGNEVKKKDLKSKTIVRDYSLVIDTEIWMGRSRKPGGKL